MEKEELSKILKDHKLWAETRASKEKKGCRAYLRDTYLRGADLSGADLHDADLSGANLSHADLRYANLRGADLDFSCLPLWCGSLRASMDDRQIKQLLYHVLSIVVNSSNVSENLRQQLLIDENLVAANEFHRVGECPVLKKQEVMEKDAKNERWKDERKNNGTDISSVRHTE